MADYRAPRRTSAAGRTRSADLHRPIASTAVRGTSCEGSGRQVTMKLRLLPLPAATRARRKRRRSVGVEVGRGVHQVIRHEWRRVRRPGDRGLWRSRRLDLRRLHYRHHAPGARCVNRMRGRQDYRKATRTREPIWYKLLDSVTLFGYITGTLKNCGSGWRGRGMGILATCGRPDVRLARRGGGQR
jgi:hypothetical protein